MSLASRLRPTLAALAAAAALCGQPAPSEASDHVDGIKTGIDNSADISDVFVFTSPADANKLVLVMNVNALAFAPSRFSNAVDYKFRIRPIDDARTLKPSTDAAKEQSIVCTFQGGIPVLDGKQKATCKLNLAGGSETLSFDTRGGAFRAGGSTASPTAKVFAGVRSDPWFLDLGKTVKFNKAERVDRASTGSNGLRGVNVLSIVVEVDKSRLGPNPLLAITAQTVRK